jgi:hypothetical protein
MFILIYVLGFTYYFVCECSQGFTYTDLAENIALSLFWPILLVARIADELPSVPNKLKQDAYKEAYGNVLEELESSEPDIDTEIENYQDSL